MKLWFFVFLISFGIIMGVLYADTKCDLWINSQWLQNLDASDWNVITYWLSGHMLAVSYLQNRQLWIVTMFTVSTVGSAVAAFLTYLAERE